MNYFDIFHLENDPPTVTNVCKETIQLKEEAKPVFIKLYRLPHAQKAEIHRQVAQMLQGGLIEETRSRWSSPLFIVPKKWTKMDLKNGEWL